MVSSIGRLSFVGLVMVSFVLHAGTANAQMCASDDIRCQNVPVTWRGEARLFDDIGFDTGFIPNNSPVSIRAAVGLLSRTTVDMRGMLRADWPSPLTVHLTGDMGMGQLNIDFGLVFSVQLKLDIDVGIASINRTFDLPVGLPSNLAFRGTQTFMPLLLPGQAGAPVRLTTTTARVRAATFSVPVITGLTVSGGLDIRGRMDTTYQTENMLVDGVTVLAETQGTLVGPANAAAGFGAFQNIPTRPVGGFEYAVSIELIPVISVEFFSFEIASIDISSFAIQAFESDGPAVFATVPAHVPLPDVRFISTAYNFPETEVGGTSSLPPPCATSARPPARGHEHAARALRRRDGSWSSSRAASSAWTSRSRPPSRARRALAMVETNDPDAPTVTLDLRGTAPFPPLPDMGIVDNGVTPDGAQWTWTTAWCSPMARWCSPMAPSCCPTAR
jgi:hypothetical protein